MKVLTIRTDKPEAEVGIFKDDKQLAYKKWQAGNQLSVTLNDEIKKILDKSSMHLNDLEAIIVYKGPGSFTGLRIGMSVANALAYSLSISIITTAGENWIEQGLKKLAAGKNEKIALPEYGAPPKTTIPKK